MSTFERKNAYVNAVKMFSSKYAENTDVMLFNIKHADLDYLLTQLNSVKDSGEGARVEITYKKQEGKYGPFVGGKIKASVAKKYEGDNATATATNTSKTDDLPFK